MRVREASEAWLDGARAGGIRTRAGDVYKPATIRSYSDSLRTHVLPELGGHRLSDLRRSDVQTLVERMNRQGLSPSSTRNAINALRAICRRAILKQELSVNPCSGLELPSVRGRRTPAVSPDDVALRLSLLSEADAAMWAMPLYCGLRLGELRALLWEDVDVRAGLVRIERSWDRVAGIIPPKSEKGRRTVPLSRDVRRHLVAHRLRTGRSEGFVFGGGTVPFDATSATVRAHRAWTEAGLSVVGFHEARHIGASLMLAAGIPLVEVSRYMGHAGIAITADIYGHLVAGSEERAAETLDAYLTREAQNGTLS